MGEGSVPASAAIEASGPPPGAASLPLETDPVPIEVVESGFSAAPDDQGGSASYGAVLRNPNATWAAVRMEVHIDFLDAGGGFINGQDVVVTILPGQTTAIGGHASGAGSAASVEIKPLNDAVAFQTRAPADGTIETSDVETVSAGGQTTTTGSLASTFPTEQTFVPLVAIYRDEIGAIVGGASGAVASVPPGGSVPFEIIEATPPAEIAATELYWQASR